jgi:hypothetical protein
MKVSQDLILGIAIGAGVALLLNNRASTAPPMIPGQYKPSPKSPGSTAQSSLTGGFYPRQAYVADLRKHYVMPAWYAA